MDNDFFRHAPDDKDFAEYYIDFFARRVSELRTKQNLSARQLSLSLGLHESYINKIENHVQNPSFNVLMLVCEYFKLTPAEFFSGDDDPAYIRQLVETARKMPPDKQKMLLGLLEDMKY